MKAVLPQDVATYLLNQKRKEISRLEDEYKITIHLTGSTTVRQNEYEMGFIKRDPSVETPSVVDRRRGRDSDDALSGGRTNRGRRGEFEQVKRDKARTQVARISQFGLLELSRQRLKPTILEGNYRACPHCDGSGLIKSTISLALTILRRISVEEVERRPAPFVHPEAAGRRAKMGNLRVTRPGAPVPRGNVS